MYLAFYNGEKGLFFQEILDTIMLYCVKTWGKNHIQCNGLQFSTINLKITLFLASLEILNICP